MLYLGCNMQSLREKSAENKVQTNSQVNDNKKKKIKSNLTIPVNGKTEYGCRF